MRTDAMKSIIPHLLLLLLPLSLAGQQNLIPNPSFEEVDTTIWPNCYERPCKNNLECALHWLNPTTDTPDHMNAGYSPCPHDIYNSVTVPENWLGHQYPRTGEGYIAIHTYIALSNMAPYDGQEYALAKLLSPLDIGRTYNFTMYVSRAEKSKYSTNGLGILLSNSDEDSYGHNIYETPTAYHEGIISDMENWVEVSFSFTANRAYQYIFIGRFLSQVNDDRFEVVLDNEEGSRNQASYYIDDVSLVPAPVPDIDLGDDVLACGSHTLESPVEAERYLWSTGDTLPSITVAQSGEYWLDVYRWGEWRRDTVAVAIADDSRVTPNPTSGRLYLEVGSEYAAAEVEWKVYGMAGRLVAEGFHLMESAGVERIPIELGHLADGVYFLYFRHPCGGEVLERVVVAN